MMINPVTAVTVITVMAGSPLRHHCKRCNRPRRGSESFGARREMAGYPCSRPFSFSSRDANNTPASFALDDCYDDSVCFNGRLERPFLPTARRFFCAKARSSFPSGVLTPSFQLSIAYRQAS